jgi:hypothetical protein
MSSAITMPSSAETVAHIVQVALAPVFLLSGIATLLNVFSTRLARISERVEQLTKLLADCNEDETKTLANQLRSLHWRSLALDAAVVLGALGAAATCASILALFVGALRDTTIASVLFTTFGLAIICTLGAIGAYAVEMLTAGSGIRAEAAAGHRSAAAK